MTTTESRREFEEWVITKLEYSVAKYKHSEEYLSDAVEVAWEAWQAAQKTVTEQRNEAISDLEFRRDLYKLQSTRLEELKRERDEAIRSCHIWQKGHAESVTERDYLLNLLQLNQPERKHIGRWGHNKKEFTSPYINQ